MGWQDIARDAVQLVANAGLKKDVVDLFKEKVALLTDKISTLEQENTTLKTENANFKQKVENLEQQLDRLRPSDELHPDAIKMMELLFDQDLAIEYMAEVSGISRGMGKHYRDVLVRSGLIQQTGVGFKGFGAMGDWVDTSGSYGLTDKGREYVAKRRAK